jgi:hypothetical protein
MATTAAFDTPVTGILRITVTAEVPARAVDVDKSVMHIDLFAVDQLTPAALGNEHFDLPDSVPQEVRRSVEASRRR